MNRRYNIVCLSSQFYRRRDDLWTNKQHIMKRLSAVNRVLYVTPPSCFSVRRALRLRRPFPFLERESENLWVFWSYRITSRKFGRNWRLNEWINTALLRRCVKKLGMREDLILWVYDPEQEYLAGKLGERLVVYDCVDIVSAFPCYADPALKAEVVRKEERLVRRADLVFATTDAIYRQKRGINSNTYLVPNVGDFEHFSSARDPKLPVAAEIERLKKPVIGFIGAVTDYKLDVPLIREVARRRPGWSIVLIGPIMEPCDMVNSMLRGRGNVYLPGKVPYDKLPSHVKGFDVCAIPYAMNEYTRGVFPIKFFEYLATGRPVVSTPLPSLLGHGDVALFAGDAGSFIDAVETALRGGDEAVVGRRIETARRNSWWERIRRIMGLIEQHWPEGGRS